ncbi:hypothetical protein F4604DRAFT_1688180 [Suillus subluteus]|nr:hypothetical protein F4604DRAFT_1688180 [Suillus subluteus]
MAPRRTASQPQRTSTKQKAPPQLKKNSLLNASSCDITSQLGQPQDCPQTPEYLHCPPNMDHDPSCSSFQPDPQFHPQLPFQYLAPAFRCWITQWRVTTICPKTNTTHPRTNIMCPQTNITCPKMNTSHSKTNTSHHHKMNSTMKILVPCTGTLTFMVVGCGGTCIGTMGPQIVGVTIPREREVDHREFSCGVIYNTSSQLTFTSNAIIGTCTHTTTTSTHAPNQTRNHPHTSASTSSNSVFIVELNKSTIEAIKVATKDELCPEMMQGRDVVPLSSKKRGTLIDNTVMKAQISVIGPVERTVVIQRLCRHYRSDRTGPMANPN